MELEPPVWGVRGFNIGAGMGRLLCAAAFIKFNLPYDNPGSLSVQQANPLANLKVRDGALASLVTDEVAPLLMLPIGLALREVA